MSEFGWEGVHGHLVGNRAPALREALATATEAQRKSFAPRLLSYVRSELPHQDWEWDGTAERSVPVLAVAAVACLPSEAAVGTFLNRVVIRDHWDRMPVELMVAAATDRGVPWLGAVLPRLVTGLPRDPWAGHWRAIAELGLATGAPVATEDRFVQGWVWWLAQVRDVPEEPGEGTRRRLTRERLLWGPFLDVLLPRVFEVDELGNDLSRDGDPTILDVIVELAAEGRLDRTTLLDSCLSRLHQMDRPGALRAFSQLHRRLDPTLEELAARADRYADLAVITPSPVAGFAQEYLLVLQNARRLDLELLLDTSPSVLERPEQVVVRRQLKLLELAARRHPDRTGAVLRVVADVFRQPVFELQRRGLTLVTRYAWLLTAADRAHLARAATGLGPDLRQVAEKALGQPAASFVPEPLESQASPDRLPIDLADQRPEFPPPIESLDELAVMLRRAGSADWVADERIRAGLLALAADQPVTVTLMLTEAMLRLRTESGLGPTVFPLMLGGWPRDVRSFGTDGFPRQQAAADHIRVTTLRGERPPGLLRRSDLPHLVRHFRMSEVVAGLAAPRTSTSPRRLLATPTDGTGRIDPAVLLQRIHQAEIDGWQPFPLDLKQALLRLPRHVDPQIGIRAGALRSWAGTRLAAWLSAGGPADPAVTVRGAGAATDGTYRSDERPGGLRHVVLTPVEPPRSDLHRMLMNVDLGPDPDSIGEAPWPPPVDVFPDHRETIMAWALTNLDGARRGDHGRLLPSGPDRGDPAGPASTLVLAYTFGAARAAHRVAAVDALLSFAAAGNLDGSGLGEQLGAMIADGTLLLSRVTPGLVETARAGATAATWEVIAALLPYVIGGKPAGLLPLLTLAVDLATNLGRRQRIPGLDQMADGPGSSASRTQARRLQAVLTGR